MTPLFNKGKFLLPAMCLLQARLLAQTGESNSSVEMADGLYQSGKIYVVITAIALICVGIIVYLILLDRKIGKLEKELKKD
jgi:CcmD family protein